MTSIGILLAIVPARKFDHIHEVPPEFSNVLLMWTDNSDTVAMPVTDDELHDMKEKKLAAGVVLAVKDDGIQLFDYDQSRIKILTSVAREGLLTGLQDLIEHVDSCGCEECKKREHNPVWRLTVESWNKLSGKVEDTEEGDFFHPSI